MKSHNSVRLEPIFLRISPNFMLESMGHFWPCIFSWKTHNCFWRFQRPSWKHFKIWLFQISRSTYPGICSICYIPLSYLSLKIHMPYISKYLDISIHSGVDIFIFRYIFEAMLIFKWIFPIFPIGLGWNLAAVPGWQYPPW